MAVYVVTGGAGFIGSHLVERLVADGHTVRVVDNLETGSRRNLRDVEDAIEFVEADVCNRDEMDRVMAGADFCLHQAAIPSVPRSVEEPLETNRASVDGTLSVLLAAKEAGVRRVVYAASSSAYGDSLTLPKVESMIADPISPYAVAKLTGEYYCRAFFRVYGLETVSLRYFNIFGPRQDPKSPYAGVIPIFMTALSERRPPTIFGDGEQTRDFTYVANAVDANLRACHAEGVSGKVLNIARGESVTVNELFRLLRGIMNVDIEPSYEPPRTGDVLHSVADIARARDLLGYTPSVGLREGLEETVRWFRRFGAP